MLKGIKWRHGRESETILMNPRSHNTSCWLCVICQHILRVISHRADQDTHCLVTSQQINCLASKIENSWCCASSLITPAKNALGSWTRLTANEKNTTPSSSLTSHHVSVICENDKWCCYPHRGNTITRHRGGVLRGEGRVTRLQIWIARKSAAGIINQVLCWQMSQG